MECKLLPSNGQQLGCGYQGGLARIPRAVDPTLSLAHILLGGSPVISRLSTLNNTFFFSIYFSSFKDCTISGWELLVECSGETSAPHLGRVQSLASGGWTLLGSLELIDCPSGSGASHFWMAIPKLPWWWTVDPWQECVWTYAFMYGDG